MNVTIYMGNFTVYEGSEHYTGYLSLEDFVPRQIPSGAESSAIEAIGYLFAVLTSLVMIAGLAVSFKLKTSRQQVWSMLNGL